MRQVRQRHRQQPDRLPRGDPLERLVDQIQVPGLHLLPVGEDRGKRPGRVPHRQLPLDRGQPGTQRRRRPGGDLAAPLRRQHPVLLDQGVNAAHPSPRSASGSVSAINAVGSSAPRGESWTGPGR
ncbi:hypothetical protein [Streptomyces sp. TLI_171]|uniref:hypothetical protein n=1 Tax=Streptomyces sp. TLI_171 TaxID=1938859 RepID=UPI00117E776A|nr:hypothetical protein [Streptomyces sp. TLI_171]